MSTGAGSDLSYANMVVMKDSFDSSLPMLSDMVRHPVVRRRRDRASAAAAPVVAAGQLRRPRFHRQRRVRPPRLRLSSVRAAAVGHARNAGVDHSRRSGRVPPEIFRPQQRHPRDRRRRHGGGSVRERAPRVWRLGAPRGPCHRRSSSRRRRRGASSSSTSRTRCRPKCASATSASRATIRTTWR